LGKNSFETATCFSNLASSLDQQEKLETAEEFFLESLKIKQKLIGPIHPELVGTMHELATNYSKQKKYDKAESLYKQTITMAEKTMGCNSPLVFVAIDQLSKLYSKQDKIFHATVLVNLSIAKRNSIKTGQKVTLESLTKDMDKMIQQEEERYRKEKNE
jgi:tetratricopeptide (TPR) repeat protein